MFQVIILIGNKADLEAQRDVTYEEAKQFAEENGKKPVWAEKMFRWILSWKPDIRLTDWLISASWYWLGLLFLEASAKT